MKKILGLAVMTISLAMFPVFGYPSAATAQTRHNEMRPEAQGAPQASTPAAPKETSSVTEHTMRIGGETILYKATAGTILLKNDNGEPAGLMFYIAYTRSDVKDIAHRPVSFFYNGGPGSSTIWLHMGAFGPKQVVTSDAAPTPPAPYQLIDNQNSLLDATDEVFIDAIGTGFSHAVGKAKNKDFWGVDQDMRSFAQFISNYVTENNRWNSPKFLIGESYGTFRSALVSNYLQSHYYMDVNGIAMISTVLDLGTLSFYPGENLSYILFVPSYATAACYHKLLPGCPEDLNNVIEQSEQFAVTRYADALLREGKLTAGEKEAVAKKYSQLTGLSEDYVQKANLRVKLPQFLAELQRSRGLTTGYLDSRFSGPSYDPLAEYAAYDPQEAATQSAFTSTFNDYIRNDLKFAPDMTYKVVEGSIEADWNWKHGAGAGTVEPFPGAPNVERDLVEAMISNPHLRVEVEAGYYDMSTPFFAAEYTIDHLELPGNLRSNISFKHYKSGHVIYLYEPAHAKLKANIAAFIESTLKQK